MWRLPKGSKRPIVTRGIKRVGIDNLDRPLEVSRVEGLTIYGMRETAVITVDRLEDYGTQEDPYAVVSIDSKAPLNLKRQLVLRSANGEVVFDGMPEMTNITSDWCNPAEITELTLGDIGQVPQIEALWDGRFRQLRLAGGKKSTQMWQSAFALARPKGWEVEDVNNFYGLVTFRMDDDRGEHRILVPKTKQVMESLQGSWTEAGTDSEIPAVEAISEDEFWELVEGARQKAGGTVEKQVELLQSALGRLAPERIAGFEQMFLSLHHKLYDWGLWGVAYLLLGGCSDDGFVDLRSWVIGQGRDFYKRCQSDPRALASGALKDPEEIGDAELLAYVAFEAYEEATGRDLHEDYPDLGGLFDVGEPTGKPWAEDDEELEARYPGIEMLDW